MTSDLRLRCLGRSGRVVLAAGRLKNGRPAAAAPARTPSSAHSPDSVTSRRRLALVAAERPSRSLWNAERQLLLMTDTTETGGFDRIEPVDIQAEMQRSYIDYAMSVIVGRALPDVRDGLKPVHRKILYGMFDSGFRPDRNYVKCGRVVGDVMGNYHPHGDSAAVRRPGAHGPAVVAALPADRPAGQLRLAGQRPGRRLPLHRVPAAASSRWRCWPTSTRRPSTSSPTTRATRPSRSSCRRGSRTCWSTAPRASRSAWRPASRRTTCARWRPVSRGPWTTRTPPTRNCSKS